MSTTTVRRICAPFDDAVARSLRAGEQVLISGRILAARDAAHKRMTECLLRQEPLPVDIRGAVVYYVGPSPAKPGMEVGSAGPTTAGRMDAYAPLLMRHGLKGMIGKGYRSPAVVEAMKTYGVPYLAAVGGAGARLARRILISTCIAYHELGPEALALMEVEDFPAVTVIDCLGNNYYEMGQAPYRIRQCREPGA